MPAELLVDREKVKMVALQIGVREAARKFEISENTVMAWSRRENWFGQAKEVQAVVDQRVDEQGLHAVVRKSPSELMAGYKFPTKLAQAKAVCKTAKGFSKLDPETLMKKTSEVLNNVSAGNKLWPEEQSTVNQTLVNINLLQADYGESHK